MTTLTLDLLSDMDYRYATGSARLAMESAQHAAACEAEGDKRLARYHRRAVVEHAKYLEAGLTRIAASLGL